LGQGWDLSCPVHLHNPIGRYCYLQRVAQLQVSVIRNWLWNPHSQAVSPFQNLSLHISSL
jgi:hypothetical protein